MKKWPGGKIQIGPDAAIDDDVILGYPTGRKIEPRGLCIGSHARIRTGSVLYDSTAIGDYFHTGHHVIVREENILGNYVEIWSNTVIDYGCRFGNHIKIHANVYICQFTVIEDNVFIAPGAAFANDQYPLSWNLKGPRIKRGARVGIHATILPGITVGENALIGAGSVVTKDVPDGAVAFGNPARVVGAASRSIPKSKD